VLDSANVYAQLLFTTGCDRIKKSQAFYIPAIAPVTTVGYDDVIERPLFGSSPGKTYAHHKGLFLLKNKSRQVRGPQSARRYRART
jgi:hypothetical protein